MAFVRLGVCITSYCLCMFRFLLNHWCQLQQDDGLDLRGFLYWCCSDAVLLKRVLGLTGLCAESAATLCSQL